MATAKLPRTYVLSAGNSISTATADFFDEIVEVLETNNQLQLTFTVAP